MWQSTLSTSTCLVAFATTDSLEKKKKKAEGQRVDALFCFSGSPVDKLVPSLHQNWKRGVKSWYPSPHKGSFLWKSTEVWRIHDCFSGWILNSVRGFSCDKNQQWGKKLHRRSTIKCRPSFPPNHITNPFGWRLRSKAGAKIWLRPLTCWCV